MSITRSITFNDITATICIDTVLNSENHLNWTVALEIAENKITTTGIVAVEPVSPNATIASPTASTIPDTSCLGTVMPIDDSKAKHVEFIKESLNTIETAVGRDAKAACAKILFDYLAICGMDFIKTHERFKQTVITKAYELKSQAPEKTSMVESMNKVLTALDQPLEKPTTATTVPPGLSRQPARGGSMIYCGCTDCPDLTKRPVEVKPTTEKKETPYSPDMALFIALSKKHDAKNAILYPADYFHYYETGVKWGTVKGATKADRMNNYLSRWSDGSERERLMKSLFTKNGLVFSDAVMTLYGEWQKEYKPTGNTNRYKKMCVFIDAHKSLFTA